MDSATDCLRRIGYLFYVVSPEDSSFARIESVPDYITEVIPYFIAFIVIEQIIAFFRGYPLIRVNDAIASLSQGIFMELTKTAFKSVAVIYYVYIYEKWRICTLDWNSSTTWLIALVAVDFGFYWIHRISHEVNLFWAAHQVHHSSQEYNLTTALRQSVLHLLFQYILYLPLAVVVPPTTFLVHNQFNVLYQFWIHTQVVRSLGPLEYILNTPSHHRVHHGRNRFCIDKNYAGVLIVWDRLFGTFQEEKANISYGLTKNLETFDPMTIQLHHFIDVGLKFNGSKGFTNKMKSLLHGPGWQVGTGRLGNSGDIPDDPDHTKYDPTIPLHHKLYILVHFAVILVIHTNLMAAIDVLPHYRAIVCSLFILFSLTSFGFIMDAKKWSQLFETIRCFAFVIIEDKIFNILLNEKNFNLIISVQYIYLISILLLSTNYLMKCHQMISVYNKSKTKR